MSARRVATWAIGLVLALYGLSAGSLSATDAGDAAFTRGARVFVASMPGGFDDYLKVAFQKKKVPLVVVTKREDADFEIRGTSESQAAGALKTLLLGDWQSDEQASIAVTNLKSDEVVFAYSVNKRSSAHGKQSTAEACAKHLKEHLESRK